MHTYINTDKQTDRHKNTHIHTNTHTNSKSAPGRGNSWNTYLAKINTNATRLPKCTCCISPFG